MIELYGIKACDTCRKARQWLDAQHVEYRWHDLREDGLDEAALQCWLDAVGGDRLINRRSTTWRQLDPASRERFEQAMPVELLLKHPTLIKRPLLAHADGIEVGFAEQRYRELLAP